MTTGQTIAERPRPPRAGAAAVDISPPKPVFLFGYPNVPRMSTGVHDPLMATALFLDDGANACLLISVDLIGLTKRQVATARRHISASSSVPPEAILIAASHTHSGPLTFRMLSNDHDPVVPQPDAEVIEFILAGIVRAAEQAVENAEPAEIGFLTAHAVGIGGNRHDPDGLSTPDVPALAVRSLATQELLALQYIFTVHPTVLHEDSTLVSGDFPGVARTLLQRRLAGGRLLPVLNHLGAAGNQSPRHAVRANTLAEMERLGSLLADALCTAIDDVEYVSTWTLDVLHRQVDLPLRSVPTLDDARRRLADAQSRMRNLQESGAARATIRTAECDLFGAEELVTLAESSADGRLAAAARECLPAEIQAIRIHSRRFVAWPGEVFLEFAQALQQACPDTVVVTLANGELQGYLVTEEAVQASWYEASNALFASPLSGDLLVAASRELLSNRSRASEVAAS